jgi:hypothetical protein
MILDIVISKDGVPIRLTEERWYEHIILQRPYLSGYLDAVLETVENPQFILRGNKKSKIAVINLGRNKWLHVVYKELSKTDGFIITAMIKDDYNENLIIWTRKF